MSDLRRNVCRGFLILPLFFLNTLSSCDVSATSPSSSYTWFNAIEIVIPDVQREKQKFTLQNRTSGIGEWNFKIIDAESGEVITTERTAQPTLALKRGNYDVHVEVKGKNQLIRHYRRFITVLPKIFNEREADEIIDLSKIKTDSYIRDFGNKPRPGYKILIKGNYQGRVKFTGLRGTRKKPVHIINKGKVSIQAENNNAPYAFQWSDNNQYILLDGKADPAVAYGFTISGHPQKSGQVFFIAGEFNRGFEICGVNFRGQQGKTNGAATIQLQTAYTPGCNADNWNFEYFSAHHNKIENASSEGMYIGYFTDAPRDGGFIPFRLGRVTIFRDTILNSGWDAIQIASADEFEVHDNYVDGASLSGKRSHSSFISWNSGNNKGWCYRNTFKNCAHAVSLIYGETGKDAFIYSNLFIEGTYPDNITSPNFFFSKITNEFTDPLLYIFNNTIITSRIPVKVDYKKTKEEAIPIIFAGNAIVMNRVNKKRYPEIAMGSTLTDSLHWTFDNVWRMKEDESEMQWTEDYFPRDDSPLISDRFDIRKFVKEVKGGFYDRNGYPLFSDDGYAYGCFSTYNVTRKPEPQ